MFAEIYHTEKGCVVIEDTLTVYFKTEKVEVVTSNERQNFDREKVAQVKVKDGKIIEQKNNDR